MKVRVTRIAVASISLMVIGLLLTGQSIAKIDPATITGMWLFDDGKGTVAKDSSGKGLDAKLAGGPEWVDGKFGKALKFNGTSAYVEVPAHENPTVAITVSVWCKSNTATWNQHGWMVEKRDAYIIHPNQGTTNVAFPICNGACWNKPVSWDTGAVGPKDITQWHMYTGTFDSKTGDWKLYIDGKVESTLALDKAPINVDTGPLYIGQDTCCAGRFGDAIIDEVAVFNVALGEADIQTIMKGGLQSVLTAVEPADKLSTTWADIKTQ